MGAAQILPRLQGRVVSHHREAEQHQRRAWKGRWLRIGSAAQTPELRAGSRHVAHAGTCITVLGRSRLYRTIVFLLKNGEASNETDDIFNYLSMLRY